MTLAIANNQPMPNAPEGWIPINLAAAKLGINVGHLRNKCNGRLGDRGHARKFDGIWHIHAAADPRLRSDGSTAGRDLTQIAELRKAGVRPAFIELAEARREILRELDRFRLKHSNRAPRDVLELFAGHLSSEGRVGPGCLVKRASVTTLYGWLAAYKSDGLAGLVPRYGDRDGGNGGPSIGEAAWGQFLRLKMTPGDPPIRDCYRIVDGLSKAEHVGDPAWAWPCYNTVRARFNRDVHPAERELITHGPYKMEANCIPKIARSLEDKAAGSHLCGDERDLDFMIRVPGREGWRRVRAKLTAWIDVRSRFMAGWVLGESANSDTILSAFKMACEQLGTIPDEITVDNGRDYRTVAGRARRHRKWDEFDSKRMHSAFERLHITEVNFALVKHPWSKIIEDHFGIMKDRLDRYVASYWGGKPDERPWDAQDWTNQHIERLPTMEEARDMVEAYFAARHEEVIAGDGMFGLSPRQALKQYFTTSPRPAAREVLELACCRMHGPVKVGRDGIRFANIRYGTHDVEVFRLQGQQVWFLSDPVHADRVTLCDDKGVPICVAFADRNLGQTTAEVRAAAAMKQQAKRILKKFPEARSTDIATTAQLIARQRRNAAKLAQPDDATLPPPPTRESLRLVGQEIQAGAERIRRAAGGEAIKRLADMNAGADALNEYRSIDIRSLDADAEKPADRKPAGRIDLRRLAGSTEDTFDAP